MFKMYSEVLVALSAESSLVAEEGVCLPEEHAVGLSSIDGRNSILISKFRPGVSQ